MIPQDLALALCRNSATPAVSTHMSLEDPPTVAAAAEELRTVTAVACLLHLSTRDRWQHQHSLRSQPVQMSPWCHRLQPMAHESEFRAGAAMYVQKSPTRNS